MQLSQKVAFNTMVQILSRVGVILISILTTTILTRVLGTSGYGNYIFILAFIMLFVSISDWGTGMISIREAAKDTKEEEKIYGSALIIRLFLVTSSFLIINFLIRLVPVFRDLILPTTIASLLLFCLSLRTSSYIIFQTKLHFENMAIIELLSSGLFLLVLILVVRLTPDVSFVFLGLLVSSFVATVLGIFFARRLSNFNFEFNKKILKKIFWESLPTGALLILFAIYNRVDIIILQSLKGSTSVGIYGLAYKVHDNLILGAAYFMNALFPVISQCINKEGVEKKLRLIYKKSFDVLFLIGLFMVFTIIIFAPIVIAVVGGSKFFQSILVLRILIFATFMASFNHLTGYTLIALGKQRVSLVVAVVALVWNVSLNLIFIPRFSFIASAFATLATEGLVLVLTSLYLARHFHLYPSFSPQKTLIEIIKKRGKIF